ncbi:hypothetical protein E2P81_ATG10511 [Venturia nashicola]|nr:hypothetical protein E2P81_ATG10511 [Venturia nashicola]
MQHHENDTRFLERDRSQRHAFAHSKRRAEDECDKSSRAPSSSRLTDRRVPPTALGVADLPIKTLAPSSFVELDFHWPPIESSRLGGTCNHDCALETPWMTLSIS